MRESCLAMIRLTTIPSLKLWKRLGDYSSRSPRSSPLPCLIRLWVWVNLGGVEQWMLIRFVDAQFVEDWIRRRNNSSKSQFVEITIRRRHYSSMSVYVNGTIRRSHSSSNRENLHKNQISGSSLKDALLKTFNRSLRSTGLKKLKDQLWIIIVLCNLHDVYWKLTVQTHTRNFHTE